MAKEIIGIDLGTTNCALAYSRAEAVEVFPVSQFVNPGEEREEPLLPSFLFIEDPPIVGVLAQKKGLDNAGRLVASAKSWLSHSGADRTAPILPPNAPEGVPRISPVDASRRYLAHLRDAWNKKNPNTPFDDHQILVTVPASFDAVARDLTRKAADEAGYRDVILLEEPQAAFYAWIECHPDWRQRVNVGDTILVIDIGGGTTDFTLISVREKSGELELERVAVGDHILLGGDNIDVALAHHVAQQIPQKLDAVQFHALWQQCRVAKEKLLAAENTAKDNTITILGRGTGLVGGTIKTKLKREDIDRLLLDGFLPVVSMDEVPQRRRAGLAEIGLPYAADPAITRHLAHFLKRQNATPTHVLFNGGVLRADLIRDRILEVLNGWLPRPVTALMGEDLMHAVARGAAYYGLARQGKGVRIRGGVPRSYYIGIETAMPAVPGFAAPLKALTVAPFGMEEGTGHKVPDRVFALTVGEPAQFRFFSSSSRKDDPPGSLIEDVGEDFEELAPIEVLLPGNAGESVPVSIEVLVTETGVLELWCAAVSSSKQDGRRWKLEFNVRGDSKLAP